MAIQVVATSHPPLTGGQYPAEFIGRFYVNPFVQISNQPEGYRTENSFQIVENSVASAKLRTTLNPIVTRVPRQAVAAPDSRNQFWIDRLHVLTTDKVLVELGNVVNDVDTQFDIMNASRTQAVTIASIGETAAAGFTFIDGEVPPPPFVIGKYGSEAYTLRAEKEEGPPTITAAFEWIPSTPGFQSVTVNFTGNRITIFVFEPEVQPSTLYEFLTSIVESYNGTEQRMAMRQNPRQSMTYRFSKGEDSGDNNPERYYEEAQALEHVIFDSLGRTFSVPVWEDREVLTAAVAASDTVINVNTEGRDFRVGELLMLWQDWDINESQEIESITSSSITVANPFLNVWSIEDTVVLPTFLGFAQDRPTQQVFRVDHAKWTIVFKRINNVDYASGASPILPDDYLGAPIWPRPWFVNGNSVTRTWERLLEEPRTGIGKIEQRFRRSTPRRKNSELRVEILNRTEYEFMRQFVLALYGRQKSFWLPSYTSNFQITATSPGGSGSIRVRQNLYTTFIANRAQFNQIQITLTDGQVFRHEIVASADVGTPPNNEIDLTLDPLVGLGPSPAIDYTVANVVRIEYLTKHRLDTDKISFQGLRPRDAATLALPIIEVINE